VIGGYQKKNRSENIDLDFFYNFYSLHFSVGRVTMIARLSEKAVKFQIIPMSIFDLLSCPAIDPIYLFF
jgi:hypothetical protein